MKLAIVGSRNIRDVNISDYVDEYLDEIVSGGAKGIDTLAREYALKNAIPLTEFLPDYERYGRSAPIVRNRLIIEHCDKVLAIWDGKSRGTLSSINLAKKLGKEIVIVNP